MAVPATPNTASRPQDPSTWIAKVKGFHIWKSKRGFYLTHYSHFPNLFGLSSFIRMLLLFPNLKLLGTSQPSQDPQVLSSFPSHFHLVNKTRVRQGEKKEEKELKELHMVQKKLGLERGKKKLHLIHLDYGPPGSPGTSSHILNIDYLI